MPENTPTPGADTVIDPAQNNAEVAAKQKAQDIAGQSTVTGEFGDAIDALDKLAAKVPKKEAAPDPKVVEPKPDTSAKPDAKPDTSAKPDDKPTKPEEKTVQPGPDPKELEKAEAYFKDSPKLPPNASPKSSEAFSSIKLKAAKEISDREQQIADLKKKLEESKNPSKEILEQQKELEELRQWRAKLDVEFDPKFKDYDKSIEQQREFIYAQLAKNPAFTPEILAQIKKYGGPDKVLMAPLLESAKDPTLQRLVEAKMADIEMAKYNKEQAIKAAKENVGQYVKERQEAQTKAAAEHARATTVELTNLLDKLDWYAEKSADDKADEATKKEIAEHNSFVAKLRGEVAAAIQDDSPQMKAILVTGMAQLFNLQRRVPVLESKLAAAEKELTETKAKWEAVKNASRSRLNESAAPSSGIPQPKTGPDVNARASDALDDIARKIMEEKQARAASGQ